MLYSKFICFLSCFIFTFNLKIQNLAFGVIFYLNAFIFIIIIKKSYTNISFSCSNFSHINKRTILLALLLLYRLFFFKNWHRELCDLIIFEIYECFEHFFPFRFSHRIVDSYVFIIKIAIIEMEKNWKVSSQSI